MTYEKVKSIILTILVITSLLLTWNLWTYQPHYDKLEQSKTVEEVSLGHEREARKIALAEKAVFHINNNYYGTVSEEDLKLMMEEISRWDFQHYEEKSKESMDILSFVQQLDQKIIHILYPDKITTQLFESMYGINPDHLRSFSFDQIIISLPSTDTGTGIVYFTSEKKEDSWIYQYAISSDDVRDFKEKFFSQAMNYEPYFPFPTDSGKLIYLPENSMQLKSYRYMIEKIETKRLRNALFSDPSLVKSVGNGEYIDAQYLMKEEASIVSYEQFSDNSIDDHSIKNPDLLQKSIEFVNAHGGWTDSYRFVELNEDRKTKMVRFRIYERGYPVFVDDRSADDRNAELKINWVEGDISKYVRNNFFLRTPLPDTLNKTLISGSDALDQIRKQEGDDQLVDLEDLTIGYSMSSNNGGLFVDLEPNWFYKYKNSKWKSLTMDDLGGEEDGLEEN